MLSPALSKRETPEGHWGRSEMQCPPSMGTAAHPALCAWTSRGIQALSSRDVLSTPPDPALPATNLGTATPAAEGSSQSFRRHCTKLKVSSMGVPREQVLRPRWLKTATRQRDSWACHVPTPTCSVAVTHMPEEGHQGPSVPQPCTAKEEEARLWR